MLYFLYRMLVYLMLPGFLLGQWIKGAKNPAYRDNINQRLGLGGNPKPSYDVWIHAVSVGEVRAIEPLVKRLAKTRSIVVTVTTPTGRETANDLLLDFAHIRYLPYDIGFCVRQFLKGIQPKQAIIAETEVWPNLIRNTKKNGIPLVYINVRLSERSFIRYQKVNSFSKKVFNQIDIIAAQSEPDASRLKALGVYADKIVVTGSLKFDMQVPPDLPEKAHLLKETIVGQRIVWICGSTRDGEEPELIKTYKVLKKAHADLLLIIVPRHPERFDSVAAICQKMGLTVVRRTENNAKIDEHIDVYLGDTLGDLGLLYSISDIAFVGGSLVPFGGQNILEPCALGIPVLFGPHMFNFEEISHFVSESGAGICVQNQQALAITLADLIQNSEKRARISEKGLKLIEKHKGALDKVIQLLD